MSISSSGQVIDAAQALAKQPMYILSTAGQELFHTNFLYWLASAHAAGAAEPVFQALGMPSSGTGQLSGNVVRREYRHVDLYFDAGMGSYKLVLENKVSALPDPEQLTRYARLFAHADHTTDMVFTLLSLVPPHQVPEPWIAVDYDELIEPLRSGADALEPGFDHELVHRYADLVEGLVRVRDAVRPSSMQVPWLLQTPEREVLQDLRVLSLVEKMRGTLLAQEIRRMLNRPELALEVGLSNSIGLVSFYSPPLPHGGHQLGWQIQGTQFRLAVLTREDPRFSGAGNRAAREAFVARTYAEHFAFEALQGASHTLGAARARKEWLGYNPDFVYQYRPINDDASWGNVVALCADAVRHSS